MAEGAKNTSRPSKPMIFKGKFPLECGMQERWRPGMILKSIPTDCSWPAGESLRKQIREPASLRGPAGRPTNLCDPGQLGRRLAGLLVRTPLGRFRPQVSLLGSSTLLVFLQECCLLSGHDCVGDERDFGDMRWPEIAFLYCAASVHTRQRCFCRNLH